MQRYILPLILLIGLYESILVFAHEKHQHEEETSPKIEASIPQEALNAMNHEYLERVRPIFKQKCFDCHSQYAHYPWYYAIPGLQQLLDHDMEEGKKHLDMSNDFPFKGHEDSTPLEDLEEIEKVIQKNKMPLFRYKLLHWNAWWSDEEKEAVLKWLQESQQKIHPHIGNSTGS
jgi:hypothetical protein